MTPKQLLARFRTDVLDLKSPPLWSDLEVCGYMHDAQQMLCRLTDGLRDASSAATRIAITTGEPWVDIDPCVLRIRGASLTSTGRPVKVLSYEDVTGMDSTQHPWPFTPTELALSGPVTVALIGMEEGRLRLIRIPVASDTLQLVIERLPLVTLAVDKASQLPDELEVREEHHLSLLLWMEHLAYAKQDAETFDDKKSADKERAFRAYCAAANDEKRRRNSKPRLIAYGGL